MEAMGVLASACCSWGLHDLREKNKVLQEQLWELQAEMNWWRMRCLWFEGEREGLGTDQWPVRISSSHTDSVAWASLKDPLSLGALPWCETACPMCKRPLALTVWNRKRASESQDRAQDTQLSAWRGPAESLADKRSYAYCAAIWGASGGYALGALVLAARLRELDANSGRVSPDLVLLHTDDVPLEYLKLLATQWKLREVAYIDAVPALYDRKGGCFDGVFTKLQAWGLIEYEKVLLLDLDMIPLESLHDLFELQTPAAMVRGSSDWPHGERVDGGFMFSKEDAEDYPWGQGGGINAGVILLKPCSKTFAQMLLEVTSEIHPEHVPGSGPEQDYLSRFFARSGTPWHSINVAYNFQLHHMPYALNDVLSWRKSTAERGGDWTDVEWMPPRLMLSHKDIKNVHFSGNVKLWHVILDTVGDANRLSVEHEGARWENNTEFLKHLLRDCSGDLEQKLESLTVAGEDSQDDLELVKKVHSDLHTVAQLALTAWRACADNLLEKMPGILQDLLCPNGLHDTRQIGARVEVSWPPDTVAWKGGGEWYPATITSVHHDGHYCLRFDTRHTERRVAPDRVRKLKEDLAFNTEMEETNRLEISSLEERVQELEKRVQELEGRLGESAGTKTERSVTQAAGG